MSDATDDDFDSRAERTLAAIERARAGSGADVDTEVRPGGVLELEFADGSKMVINRHSIAREIWVAARSGGFHYRWDGACWRDTRDASELFAALSKLVSAQSGSGVVLAERASG
jgi:CyaY protein